MASAWSQLDQLLTCAICLDRYRNPKLLPCQHTFCMEPCLDGLIDYARRQIKCPECRAEHRIPYKGIQEFPTNVTLMRFLELHRDITGEEPEPPPSMMERCGVCSEKANLEKCAHCDKKICPDCKEAHIDILRREINRINNQVRRGLHRLADALSQTKKNAEKLQQNCSQVKDEIEDIVKRYAKDLKHTEEKLKNDLQVYTEAELKAINKLKEDLEAEVSNMTSNCDLVDKHIKDDDEWSDAELLEYKDIFIKMLDFLRSFDADTTDYSRKIKFQPRADPDVLHRNIADFGELKINAPPSASIPSQQSLAPPSSNALMRSQSDHRLAAQFARRTEGRSFTDRYGGSDSERDPGRPTSPLYGRGRRDTDSSSGYRRYTRDYDYERSNRYAREDNVSSSILSSRWRDSDEYGHRSSRYPRDYEDYDSEPQQQQNSRTVRFAEDPPQRVRIFDVNEATKGPLSGVIRLMDSPKLMERLHQNEVRHKQHKTEKDQTQPVVETPPQSETRVPTAPQAPPRKTPVRQLSEDDIDRQKKANQQANSSSSTNAQQNVPQTQESVSRSNVYKGTTETAKTPAPTRAQRKDSTEIFASTPAENVTSIERQESRVRKQPSIPETTDEPETTTPSITRRSKPTLGKTLSSDERGSTAAQQQPETSVLDKKTSNIATPHSSLLTPRSKHYEVNSKNEDFHNDESPIPVQSSFFSRQRRLPDPEPRLLQNQTSEEDDDDEDDEEEDDEEEEEEEEEEESEDESDIRLPQADVKQFQANKSSTEETVEETESEESSTDSSTSESESDDSDQVEEKSNQNGVQDSSREIENKTTTSTYRSPSPKYESPLEDEDDDDDEEVEDAMDYGSENRSINSEQKVSLPTDVNNSRPRFRRRSDDLDTAESSSGSSTSTNYKSFSNTPTVLSNGTIENNSVDSENSSSTSTHKKEPRFSSPRKRPTLARSKSSHELGIGSQAVEDVDDEEIPEDTTTAPSYRSRSDRTPEDNIFHQRPRRKYGSLSSDTHSSTESAPGLSPTSSSWATYLKNKYSSGGSGRVVPRSRSSHSLYQKSDSESSDDETSNAILGGSIGFPNPRSTYMQKRRMLLKIGSRGTEPGNFTWPRGIAVAPDDSIVVADSSNHRVQVFDTEGHFSFEFGSYGSCEGQFDCLSGVSVNRIGQFIVSDRYNHRVQLFDPSGRFLRAFGSEGHTDGRFNYPWGITTDSLGFIYVCDKDNHRVQVFQSDGTFVGKFGCLGSRPGQLEHPHYIAVSNTNRVVVSDSNNHRVQIYDVNGRTLSTFGSEGSGEGQFKFPRGVAVDDQGFIIVGDSGNNRIQIFHPDGTFLRGFGTWGSGEGEFKGLEGIAVASSGNILVCDRENHRIQVF